MKEFNLKTLFQACPAAKDDTTDTDTAFSDVVSRSKAISMDIGDHIGNLNIPRAVFAIALAMATSLRSIAFVAGADPDKMKEVFLHIFEGLFLSLSSSDNEVKDFLSSHSSNPSNNSDSSD